MDLKRHDSINQIVGERQKIPLFTWQTTHLTVALGSLEKDEAQEEQVISFRASGN